MWTSSVEGKSSLLTSFLISGPGIPEASLTTKGWDKEDIEYLGLFCLLCHQLPYTIPQLAHIFPNLPFAADAPEEAFVVALHVSHHSFSSRWALAYLISSVHAWTMFLYSSWVICPFFYVLYTSFLHLSFSQELSVHPHRPPATFAWLSAYQDGLFLSFKEVIIENQTVVLDLPSL